MFFSQLKKKKTKKKTIPIKHSGPTSGPTMVTLVRAARVNGFSGSFCYPIATYRRLGLPALTLAYSVSGGLCLYTWFVGCSSSKDFTSAQGSHSCRFLRAQSTWRIERNNRKQWSCLSLPLPFFSIQCSR